MKYEKSTIVVLSFCESCNKYGAYVILTHLLYSVIFPVRVFCNHFLRIRWLSKSRFSCWIPAHVVSDLHHAHRIVDSWEKQSNLLAESCTEICLSFWGPSRKCQGICAAKETAGLESRTGGKAHCRISSLFYLASLKILAEYFVPQAHKDTFASLHPPYTVKSNFYGTLISQRAVAGM